MSRFVLPTLLFVVLAVVGCTQIMPSKEIVGNSILLRVELEQATDSLLGLPLNDSERELASAAVADFAAITRQLDRSKINMDRLRAIVEQPTKAGRSLLDDMVGAYLMAHLAYTSYLERTGETPDPLLVRYDESARELYTELDEYMRNNSGRSDLRTLQGYLALTLRAVAAFKFAHS